MKLFIFSMLIFNTNLFAQANLLSIQPVLGYERAQKIYPVAHTTNRLIYGLRANFGLPVLSAEAEITQGKDTESFAEQDITVKETATNIMLGARSSFIHTSIINAFARAGGHLRKRKREVTENGVGREESPATSLSPYAGAGLRVNLLNILSVNAGYTAIFIGEPTGSDIDSQVTLGFNISI